MIYFISNGQKEVKIGKANDPYKRLSRLQTGSSSPLEIIGIIHGGIHEEKALHKKLAHLHIRGEWFHHTAEIDEIIKNRYDEIQSEIYDQELEVLVSIRDVNAFIYNVNKGENLLGSSITTEQKTEFNRVISDITNGTGEYFEVMNTLAENAHIQAQSGNLPVIGSFLYDAKLGVLTHDKLFKMFQAYNNCACSNYKITLNRDITSPNTARDIGK